MYRKPVEPNRPATHTNDTEADGSSARDVDGVNNYERLSYNTHHIPNETPPTTTVSTDVPPTLPERRKPVGKKEDDDDFGVYIHPSAVVYSNDTHGVPSFP